MTGNGEYYYQQFLAKKSSGEFEDALVELGKAIEVEPTNPDYYLIRGSFLFWRDVFDLAISDFTKVIELSSNLDDIAEAHHLRANAHQNVGDFSSFLGDLDWLIENDYADEGIYMWRGLEHERAGNYPQAILDFTKVLELKPNYEAALSNRALTHYQMKHYDQAERDLSQIVSIGNQHPTFLKYVYHWRGMARYQSGKTTDALEDFNEVLRLRGETSIEDVAEYLASSSDISSWFYS